MNKHISLLVEPPSSILAVSVLIAMSDIEVEQMALCRLCRPVF